MFSLQNLSSTSMSSSSSAFFAHTNFNSRTSNVSLPVNNVGGCKCVAHPQEVKTAHKTKVARNANMEKLQAGYLFPEVCIAFSQGSSGSSPTNGQFDGFVDLDTYDTIALKVKGDGRSYISTIYTENWVNSPGQQEDNSWQAFVLAPNRCLCITKIPLYRPCGGGT